jgi:serine/threonine-protein kinase RsbW
VLRVRKAAAPAAIVELRHEAVAFAAAAGADAALRDDVALALSEAVTNAVRHAYPEAESGEVLVEGRVDGSWIEFRVSDRGLGFRTGSKGGMGIGLALIACVSDAFEVEQSPQGTRLIIRFASDRG